jgi:MFS family permease
MLPVPYALDALNFLAADVRNLFGPFVNVFLVTSRDWSQTDVGLVTTASGLLGIALQTPIGAAIDVTRAKRGVIVLTMAAMTTAGVIIFAAPTFWPMAIALSILAVAGDAFAPAVSALTLGLVTEDMLARRLGRKLGVRPRRQHCHRAFGRRSRLRVLAALRLSHGSGLCRIDVGGGARHSG